VFPVEDRSLHRTLAWAIRLAGFEVRDRCTRTASAS
jgi:hypothetical protein